jgi:hypothetical protein
VRILRLFACKQPKVQLTDIFKLTQMTYFRSSGRDTRACHGCPGSLPFRLRSFDPRGASHNNRGPDGVGWLIVMEASAWCLAICGWRDTRPMPLCSDRWGSKIDYGWHARRDVKLLPSTIRSRFVHICIDICIH